MTLSPELIGALVIALTSLLGGVATLFSKRSRDQRDELDHLRDDYKIVRKQLRLADRWIYAMTRVLDQRGIPVPPPPEGLQTSNPEIEGSARDDIAD